MKELITILYGQEIEEFKGFTLKQKLAYIYFPLKHAATSMLTSAIGRSTTLLPTILQSICAHTRSVLTMRYVARCAWRLLSSS